MSAFLRIDLNVFAILFAIVLAAGSRSRRDRGHIEHSLFILMLGATIFELFADTVMLTLDGTRSAIGGIAIFAAGALYYVGHPFISMLYAFYAEHRVASDSRRARSWMPFLALPAALSGLLSLSTPFTGLYFFLDAGNVYHRGPLFPVLASVSYSYMLFAIVIVLVAAHRRVVDRGTLTALLVFPLPPMIAGAFQIRHSGLVLLWPAAVLSLLVIFIEIQKRKLSSDYLTGAFNRRHLDEYVEARVREFRDERAGTGRRGKRFAGFLVDVDDFKIINDRFGHAAGDEALVVAVQLIGSCLRSDDFLARYAGDEFVAILPLSSENELVQVVGRLRARFADFDPPQGAPYRLSLSIGAAVFDPEIDKDADKYIARLDYLMYIEKMAKKASKAKDSSPGETP